MNYTKIAPIVFISFLAFFGMYANSVNAEEGVGIKLRPAIIEEKADPGGVYSFTLGATNISEEEKTFFLSKENIRGVAPDGLPIFAGNEEETPYELSSWIIIPQDSVVIGAGETKEIPFSIKVPLDASPGAHFGGIFLDARPPKLRETGAGIGYKVGTIINLRISGEILEEARLREFTAGKLIFNIPKVDFKARIENVGNVLIRPNGILEITDMFGKQVANIRVNENGAAVFPKAEKDFGIKWDHEGFAFGRYQAVLSLVYGEEGRKTISQAVSLWVLPLKPILISLGGVLGFIILLFIFIKLHIRRKLSEMGSLSGVRSKHADSSLYYKQHKPTSKLTVIFMALLLFAVVFLLALFFLFA